MENTSGLRITGVLPASGAPGGELVIKCQGFAPGVESKVMLGDVEAPVLSASAERVIVRLPESPCSIGLTLRMGAAVSPLFPFNLAVRLADGLHPVTNPVVTADGSVITTISGSRGQSVDRPLVRVTRQGEKIPYPCEIMNPTGLAFAPDGQLYISSRHDRTVLRYTDFDKLEVVAEEMGIPCGLAFDSQGRLLVGDRTGHIWRLTAPGGREELAALEPSVSAYHLAVDATDRVYVTGPTFAVRDGLYRVSPEGRVERLLDGLARPQGMAFLPDGDLLLATGYKGKKGIFRYAPAEGSLRLCLTALILTGLALTAGEIYLVTADALYRAALSGASVN